MLVGQTLVCLWSGQTKVCPTTTLAFHIWNGVTSIEQTRMSVLPFGRSDILV